VEQEIRFCTSGDTLTVAWARIADGERAVVYAAGFPAHLELEWERPSARAMLEALAAGSQLVRYDLRGCGLSDRDTDDFSLDALVGDLAAVVQATGFDSFTLLSMGMLGAPTAVAYAASHPDRVSHLVMCSSYAEGARTATPERQRALLEYTASFGFPVMDFVEGADRGAGLDRTGRDIVHEASTPAVQAALLRTMFTSDVRALLPRLTMPVTVLHGRGDRLVPFAEGRALAAAIGHAQFIPIEGNTGSALTERDSTVPAIRRALSMGDPATAAATPGGLRTVLFTDIVGHSEMMSRLGDAAGRDALREHERITRETLARYGGTEVKTMGDGFMASFGSATGAVACAVALQRAFAARETDAAAGVGAARAPLAIRVGINAGEPIEEDGDLFGATVILASRVCAQAGAGEILIPEPVRHLLAGKGHTFADRGVFAPKGFDDAVRLYEVRWQA
jgi:class 3 adenylate cyclase